MSHFFLVLWNFYLFKPIEPVAHNGVKKSGSCMKDAIIADNHKYTTKRIWKQLLVSPTKCLQKDLGIF